MLTNLLSIFVAACITQNIVFSKTLGICPYLGVSKKTNSAVGMGLAVTFVIALASAVCFVLYHYVLVPLKAEVLQTLLFILIIASLVQVLDIVLKKFTPALYNSLGVYLALITTNCAVLGTANQIISSGYNFGETMIYAIGIGLGFLIALILMAGVREKLELAKTPKAFQGFALALIIASIMAMAFTGISGIQIGG